MQFQIQTLSKIAASVLLAAVAAHASAGTVVLDSYPTAQDPVGPDPYGWPSAVFSDDSGRQDVAVTFTLTSATSIQSILTSLDGSGGVTLGIMAGNGGTPTGDWLYSTHLTDPVMDTPFAPNGWSLGAGTYWLATVADTGFEGQWQSGTEDYSGDWAANTGTGWSAVTSTYIGMPAARITVDGVSAVPEPGSYALLLAGGLLVATLARRKSHARQQG